jgi:hypothetical protein
MPASRYSNSSEPHAEEDESVGRLARWLPNRWSFRSRLVAGMLAVLLPVVVVLAALLTARASQSLTKVSESHGQSVARAVSVRVEDWIAGRRQILTVVAARATGRTDDPAVVDLLAKTGDTYPDLNLLEVTDLTGKAIATSRQNVSFDPTGMDWFRTPPRTAEPDLIDRTGRPPAMVHGPAGVGP